MPYYDYRCDACGKHARLFFTYAEYGKKTAVCPHCSSKEMKRRIRRVALAKSEDARMDTLMNDDAMAGLDEDDPRSIGKFMRKMSSELGEDMGDEFNEVVGRLEKGEAPESIEKSMPGLGSDEL
jgi:putative FmdB family regulatory protein